MNLRLILSALMLLLAGLSPMAFAATYQWKITSTGSIYNSPLEACDSRLGVMQAMGNYTGERSGFDRRSPTQYYCSYWNSSAKVNVSSWLIDRIGDGCPTGQVYDDTEGVDKCVGEKPTDAECITRGNYTKTIQFSYNEGGAVFEVDPEIKDGCIYEPGMPDSCDESACTVDMIPVGNDDMSDNPDNPDQQLQDYLDELAKKFECKKTANGTVGCTGAQTTPPDIDPDDKCPDGFSWSGSACFPTTGGGNENPDNPGGNTGGGNSGGGDGGTNPGTGGGDGDGDGNNSGGGGGNDGTSGGKGPKESLEQPKQGSWEESLTTWTAKVEEAKKEFSEKIKENADQLKGVFDLNLGEGGGKLPCDTFVVWKKTVSLCFTEYEEKLSYLRYALMFMASVLAAFVILKE
ncbi:hypothetical protein IB274_11880 [Pseudomonas sp. PDM18]|uniref:hypothetical protein n=1 Tax=Pseudomonas sp. PDM18 TaxID=2769253 RepID=UPI00177FBACB|nr:hypothetical protein [Pseudomonas sp. PDM18]MBD9677401.1 hypothetical protein [Pseudomonas sp. PDM18]